MRALGIQPGDGAVMELVVAECEDISRAKVEAIFRHSTGELGTRFFKAIRDEHRLLGWRTGLPARVVVPPKDLGLPGEWVELGPLGTLDAYAPLDWQALVGVDADSDSCLALVTVDGADTALLSRLRPGVTAGGLAIGQRLILRFAPEPVGSITDFWFEPVQE